MNRLSPQKICAVFVAYFPDPDIFNASVNALCDQVDQILIVDNTPEHSRGQRACLPERPVVTMRLQKNLGIAAGHNLGIAWAKKRGFSHVLLMDQDSIASRDMVACLKRALTRLQASHKIAAVGPNVIDPRSGAVMPFAQRGKFLLRTRRCPKNSTRDFEVINLISSGTLIPMDVIDDVGGMNEAFFIDYVDIEWGLRAKHKGYQSFAVCSARLFHRLGSLSTQTLFFRKRKIIVHPPLRHYYQYRNGIALYGKSYTPLWWIVYDLAVQRCFRFFVVMMTAPHPLRCAVMIFRGIGHALTGRTGKAAF